MDIEEQSDVGIGVVYEQLMLNRLLERIVKKNRIKRVLEAPVYGMAGLTGINSMALPGLNVDVTLVDTDQERLAAAKKAWEASGKKANFVFSETSDRLPFRDREFDLVYNFAALWHLENPEIMLREMGRVTSDILLVCMPNPWNPIFQLRRIAGKLPKSAQWADAKLIAEALSEAGFQTIEKGLIDIPPWPDTVIPLKDVLGVFGLSKGKSWRWSMLDYYKGTNPSIKEKGERYTFIEDSALPNCIKKLWAHHEYVIARK